ncbi:MAG: radical SAM protein [Thermodesulfobacteriota bacterium]
MARKKQLIIPVFIPFGGCPSICVFCDQKSVTGAIALPTKFEVIATVEKFLSTWNRGTNAKHGSGKKEIAFYGGSFTGLPEAVLEGYLAIAFEFKRSGRVDSIRVSTRPDLIDGVVCKLLKRYGVETVELGVQSMNDTVLRLSGRGHSAADTAKAVETLKSFSFDVVMQLMPGLPGDGEASIIESAVNAAELRPVAVRLYPTVVVKGTELHEMYLKGEYEPWTLSSMIPALKKVMDIFEKQGIPVIRVGLHHSKEFGDKVVAGPYHPSLRDLLKTA